MNVLASTYYDPNGRLFAPIQQALPILNSTFDHIAITVSERAFQPTVALLLENNVSIETRKELPIQEGKLPPVGFYRRTAVSHALNQNPTHILLCDLDRAAHWANFYADELHHVVTKLPEKDFWVIGRTERAFLTHPSSMVKTESIINEVFAKVSGFEWDVVAATRGMSAEAARFIVENSRDDTFGNDPSWPLLLLENGRFSIDYLATEGMAFETADAFPKEVAAAGGVAQWIAQQDADPEQWLYRLRAAEIEIMSILSF